MPKTLSPHFTEEELNLQGCDDRVIQNAVFLCEQLLEPIRSHYQLPLCITSGERCQAHNHDVGGKPTSFHLYEGGHAAADFRVLGIAVTQLFNWIRGASGLPFDKVILEYKGDIPDIVHIQIDRLNAPRREAYIGQTGNAQHYTKVEVG